jgi:hypothetical protein
MGKPAATDRRCLPSLNHSFTLDSIAHCHSAAQAHWLKTRIAARLAQCHLELHPDKTHIVYCKDADRRGSAPRDSFDFLGYVRHEVAYTAVMTQKGGHNLVSCHQYPTQTCGWSNPAV